MKIRSLFIIFLCLYIVNIYGQPATFSPRGIGGGGALFFPSINPANDNDFYVSCDMSELFHSSDFGLSYSQIDFSKLQVFNTSTYEFTSDPNIAYSNFNEENAGYQRGCSDTIMIYFNAFSATRQPSSRAFPLASSILPSYLPSTAG